ncbi:hypothetical protein [Prosthecochloris sp. SCSIO W1103]|nr:hypothetical protein [Prosthecochloris sp. SCSIO W1103]UZJ38174.1 hypothetical protein OO005_02940 [Prosthecochloris sp. SCSIO W1103]
MKISFKKGIDSHNVSRDGKHVALSNGKPDICVAFGFHVSPDS